MVEKGELEIQKSIAYTAGLLQGDVTIKTLIESLAEGVIIVNDTGRIILINKRMGELTGYGKQEVMGESINILIPSENHAKHTAHLAEFFNHPRIRPMGIGLDLMALRKDKTTFPVEISLSFLDTDTGRLGIAFLTDITSRKLAEDELKKRNIELDAYAHTVAHNLNSSVTGIVGISDMLIDDSMTITKEKQQFFLKQIAQNGRKMTNVIRELLIFASMKKELVEMSFVNINDSLNNALERLKYQVEENNAIIIRDENLLNCSGYSPWIEEIWLNFLSNAIKYGGKPPRIEITSSKTGNGFIRYDIKDNGKGMADNIKKQIFELQAINKEQDIKGYGLGLSIVKRIIEKLDGYLTVDSTLNEGSTFSFYLKE